MKGLIFKEFYLGRKRFLTALMYLIIISVFSALTFISLDCGNLADFQAASIAERGVPFIEEEQLKVTYTILVHMNFIIILFSGFLIFDSFEADHKVKWDLYQYASPMSEWKIAGANFLSVIISAAVSVVLGLLDAVILSAVSGFALGTDIIKNFAAILIVVSLFATVEAPLMYRYKSMNACIARGALIGLALGIAIMFLLNKYLIDNNMEMEYFINELVPTVYAEIRDAVVPFTPIILIVCFGIGYLISVKVLKRREK